MAGIHKEDLEFLYDLHRTDPELFHQMVPEENLILGSPIIIMTDEDLAETQATMEAWERNAARATDGIAIDYPEYPG